MSSITHGLKVAVSLCYSIMFFVSITGNTLLLYITFKKPAARTIISYLFVNMAVSDLVFTLFIYPTSVSYYYRSEGWVKGSAGEVLCKMVYFVPQTSVAVSIFSLTVVACERFEGVILPFRRGGCLRNSKMTTVGIWCSAAACMIPLLIVPSSSGSTDCFLDWEAVNISVSIGPMLLTTWQFVILYLVPLLVMGSLYSMVCYKLWIERYPGDPSTDSLLVFRARNRRVVRFLIIIVIVFALCWFPTHFFHFESNLFEVELSPILMFLCFWVSHSHSAINPWLYITFNNTYRQAFLDLIGRKPANGWRTTAVCPIRNDHMEITINRERPALGAMAAFERPAELDMTDPRLVIALPTTRPPIIKDMVQGEENLDPITGRRVISGYVSVL